MMKLTVAVEMCRNHLRLFMLKYQATIFNQERFNKKPKFEKQMTHEIPPASPSAVPPGLCFFLYVLSSSMILHSSSSLLSSQSTSPLHRDTRLTQSPSLQVYWSIVHVLKLTLLTSVPPEKQPKSFVTFQQGVNDISERMNESFLESSPWAGWLIHQTESMEVFN